jgi:hypothetical protein
LRPSGEHSIKANKLSLFSRLDKNERNTLTDRQKQLRRWKNEKKGLHKNCIERQIQQKTETIKQINEQGV